LLAAVLSSCLQPPEEQVVFVEHQIATSAAPNQSVLTGFLLGGPAADLVVVSDHGRDDHRWRVDSFDGTAWVPALHGTFPPQVLFVDVANIAGHDRLLTYEPGLLSVYDFATGQSHGLVTLTSNSPPADNGVPHVDITEDLNSDGLDDLVVPDVDGFWIVIQRGDGNFAEPLKLGPPMNMHWLYATEGSRFSPWKHSRIHEMDDNRDGRTDLAFWRQDHFEVHLQNDEGLFSSSPRTFTTQVAFDSDDLASLVAPQGMRYRRRDEDPAGELCGRVLHSLDDRNGDGVADLVVFSLAGEGLTSLEVSYDVHFGAPTADGGTVFAEQPSTQIQCEGLLFGLESHDFDGDGRPEMSLMLFDPGVFKIIGMLVGWLFTDSVSWTLNIYAMDDDGRFAEPNASFKAKVQPSEETGVRSFYMPVLVGDVDGDGRSDLLTAADWDELHLHVGAPGSELFARQHQVIDVRMPAQEFAWLADLDRNGKQDVVLHHRSPNGPQQVTILLSR